MSKSGDDIKKLQRSLNRLEAVGGALFSLGNGVYLAPVERASPVRDPEALLDALRAPAPSESDVLATLRAGLRLEGEPRRVDVRWLAETQRDYKLLAESERYWELMEQFPRYFREKPEREALERWRAAIDRVSASLSAPASPAPSRFDAAQKLLRELRGTAAARQLAELIRPLHPATLRERAGEILAPYALTFSLHDASSCALDEELLAVLESSWTAVKEKLAPHALSFEQVLAILALPRTYGTEPEDYFTTSVLGRAGAWVAGGLSVESLQRLACVDTFPSLVGDEWDAATVQSYARWVALLATRTTRVTRHTQALDPAVFLRLRHAKNEELAVLSMCLLDEREQSAQGRLARMGATLALFDKLPERARECLRDLGDAPAGLGVTLEPAFAAWLSDSVLLDRYLHLRKLLGVPQTLSHTIRADFEQPARRAAELAHLQKLAAPTSAQRERIAMLQRPLAAPSPDWTRRHLAERVEAMTVRLFQDRFDAALGAVLRSAFGCNLVKVTPAWRDIFRFYLLTEHNQDHLGTLLRNASGQPGKYFIPTLPANRAWLASASTRMNVAAWTGPSRSTVTVGSRRYVLALEEDPLEVLRMGIPFDTCLRLEGGQNAASTVLNALDVNKRVVYLKTLDGTIVGRQLLAISPSYELLRYRVYAAIADDLTQLFDTFARELAERVGIALAKEPSVPYQLHGGFWYDDHPIGTTDSDGATDFSPEDLAAYCAHYEVPVPPRESVDDVMGWAIKAFRALRSEVSPQLRDVVWQEPFHRRFHSEQGLSLVQKVASKDELLQRIRAGDREQIATYLFVSQPGGAMEVLRAARQSGLARFDYRLDEALAGHVWWQRHSFESLCELGRVTHAVQTATGSVPGSGLGVHLVELLKRWMGDLSLDQFLTVCDLAHVPLDAVIEHNGGDHGVIRFRESEAPGLAEFVYTRDPRPQVVLRALSSPRRSATALRAALRIAARFFLTNDREAERDHGSLQLLSRRTEKSRAVLVALAALAREHPELEDTDDFVSAKKRHSEPRATDAADPTDDSAGVCEELGPVCEGVPETYVRNTEAPRTFALDPADAGSVEEALAVLEKHGGLLVDGVEECSNAAQWLLAVQDELPPSFQLELLTTLWNRANNAPSESLLQLTKQLRVPLTWDLVARLCQHEALDERLSTGFFSHTHWYSFTAAREQLRTACARHGLDADAFLARWIARLAADDISPAPPECANTADSQLVARWIVAQNTPADWVRIYKLTDHTAMVSFVAELQRAPHVDAATLRQFRQLLKDAESVDDLLLAWVDCLIAQREP